MEEKKPSTRLTLPLRKRRPLPEDEVSTVLTLWDPTWPKTANYNTKKRKTAAEEIQVPKPSSSSSSGADHDHQKTTNNSSRPEKQLVSTLSVSDVDLNKIKVQTKKKKLMKERTNRFVARLNELNSWGIKKTLTARDLEHLHVPTSMMNNHVLPYVDDNFSKAVESREGAQVTVLDWDTHNAYRQSIFKLCTSSSTSTSTSTNTNTSYVYVFFGIVKRRQLKEGDVIGLHWLRKQPKPIFLFSVLKRPTQQRPPTPLHQASDILKLH